MSLKHSVIRVILLSLLALPMLIVSAAPAQASIKRAIVKKNISLKPGETYSYEVKSKHRLRIGWIYKQEKACKGDCIRAHTIDRFGNTPYLDSRNGTSMDYAPIEGKISITYENVSNQGIILDLYAEHHRCDSSACSLLKKAGAPHPFDYDVIETDLRRFVIKNVRSIKTSKDGSYSRIKGTTLYGDKFDIYTIWWLYEPPKDVTYEQPIMKNYKVTGYETRKLPNCAEKVEEHGDYKRRAEQAFAVRGMLVSKPETNILYGTRCYFVPAIEIKGQRDY